MIFFPWGFGFGFAGEYIVCSLLITCFVDIDLSANVSFNRLNLIYWTMQGGKVCQGELFYGYRPYASHGMRLLKWLHMNDRSDDGSLIRGTWRHSHLLTILPVTGVIPLEWTLSSISVHWTPWISPKKLQVVLLEIVYESLSNLPRLQWWTFLIMRPLQIVRIFLRYMHNKPQ